MSLKELLQLNELNFDDRFYEDCEIFTKLLKQWGRVHNLTGSLETSGINENILDSIYPLKFINEYNSFADIGTGAGYPGLILAIALRDCKCYLIEPRVKRVAFLNFVKATLKLDNLIVLCKRVEKIDNIKVDLITSRAVTDTKLLLNLTKDIKKPNSSYLFYKGSFLKDELKDSNINNYEIVQRKDRSYLYIKGS
ncbi:MAG: 16S rRNA (guanine(527)-N(7))-methyltransferase RsmG [Campylobacterota bacterium]